MAPPGLADHFDSGKNRKICTKPVLRNRTDGGALLA